MKLTDEELETLKASGGEVRVKAVQEIRELRDFKRLAYQLVGCGHPPQAILRKFKAHEMQTVNVVTYAVYRDIGNAHLLVIVSVDDTRQQYVICELSEGMRTHTSLAFDAVKLSIADGRWVEVT